MFAILASHSFQSNLDVKSTLQVVVAGPLVAKTKADMPTINAKRNIAALYVKKVRKTRMEKRREKISDLGDSYICHSCECPLSGAQKMRRFQFLLYPK